MSSQDLRETVARAIYEAWNISGVPYDSESIRGNAFKEGKALAQADAAIAAVRRWDCENGPSEAEQEAFYRVVIGKPSLYTIARGLRAAAEVRAGGEQHG